MSRFTLQIGIANTGSLLLKLAVLLVLCQFALWMTQPEPMHSRRAYASSASEQPLSRASHLPALPQRIHFVDDDPSRYYDPALVSVAENLDAQSRYHIAVALEECYGLSHDGLPRFRDDFARRLDTTAYIDNWTRRRAFERSIRHCVAFDGAPISPVLVLDLLQSAARDGDPRAIARTLLFRDLAESKAGNFDVVTRLLSTGDAHVIRDVGFFLTRGESALTMHADSAPVRATTLAAAWELVACDFGLDCGGDSKMLANLCAWQGQCGAFSFDDWLGRYTESAEELADIRRLRMQISRSLLAQDWPALGLSMLKADATMAR